MDKKQFRKRKIAIYRFKYYIFVLLCSPTKYDRNEFGEKMNDSLEGNDVDKAMEDQIAELKTKEES